LGISPKNAIFSVIDGNQQKVPTSKKSKQNQKDGSAPSSNSPNFPANAQAKRSTSSKRAKRTIEESPIFEISTEEDADTGQNPVAAASEQEQDTVESMEGQEGSIGTEHTEHIGGSPVAESGSIAEQDTANGQSAVYESSEQDSTVEHGAEQGSVGGVVVEGTGHDSESEQGTGSPVNDSKTHAPTSPRTAPHKSTLTREQLEFAAACAQELKQRMAWRDDPAQWCRERVQIEPSWKAIAARQMILTPEEFERKHGGELEDKFIEILESVRDNENTLVQSGHQIGKTLAAACVILWFLDVFRPSRAITTSATWTDVEAKLWGTIRTLYRKNGQWFGIDALETALKITDEHYALGLSPKEVEPFQGHNAKHVIVVFDEASSIAQKFFDAASAEATRTLAIGNPLLAEGAFFKNSKSADWHTIKVSCLDHPNVKFSREVIAGGPRKSWVESRKRAWGERGPLYLSRVLGEFPEESEDTLFALSTIHACFDLYEKVRELPACDSGDNVLGLDVARMGGDKTIGYGSDWCQYEGRLVKRVRKVIDFAYTDHHKTRMEVAARWKAHNFHHANVDAGGEGSGLADELPKMGEGFSVNRILFGSNPQNDDYFNARAEMYWQLSGAMKSGNYAVEQDDELEEELSVTGGMRDYKEKMVRHKKKLTFWLPPKEEIKIRLLRSPDKADGLCLENYKGVTCGIFDLWREEAEKLERRKKGLPEIEPVGTAGAENEPEIFLGNEPITEPSPEAVPEPSPAQQTEQEIAKEQKASVAQFSRRYAGDVKTTIVVGGQHKCRACGFDVATYASLWKCNNCGASGPI
jgi:hypothetical protein